jgi:hypothetical protein
LGTIDLLLKRELELPDLRDGRPSAGTVRCINKEEADNVQFTRAMRQ